ncbi:FAD-dependent monooxygenase [Streptacidiphilus neutrinimicus]|uniref:FAD-dependent monooxygenase n=1 Tax=Streptacidiphilus neutrinimicus TaxID=105420 RepID=UPI0007C797CB|nr:FAD-dependent monooxygenase [Streptacidiphilus neutrinimicus]
MQIACVGGGPAGLYFSILTKRRRPQDEVTVHERLPADADVGWGVTFWADFLEDLRACDPESAGAIADHSVRWSGGVCHVAGEVVTRGGDEGYSIARRTLLDILGARARALGVRMIHDQEVSRSAQLPGADVIVVAEGAGSRLRQSQQPKFGTRITEGRNRFLWLGTDRVFESFTFAFVPTDTGDWLWCYAYPFSDGLSTFIVECSEAAWRALKLDALDREETLRLLERCFAEPLRGHALQCRAEEETGTGLWRTFRTITNDSWHARNMVLLGDAAHTTHYSIGAGTRLALQDASALSSALADHADGRADGGADLGAALGAYELRRKQELRRAQAAAHYSARWFEDFARYARLSPERLFAVLGQRHSPLLPHLPPALGYHVHHGLTAFPALRNLRRWAGHRLATTLHTGSAPASAAVPASRGPAVTREGVGPKR